jgi:hypothetical protein
VSGVLIYTGGSTSLGARCGWCGLHHERSVASRPLSRCASAPPPEHKSNRAHYGCAQSETNCDPDPSALGGLGTGGRSLRRAAGRRCLRRAAGYVAIRRRGRSGLLRRREGWARGSWVGSARVELANALVDFLHREHVALQRVVLRHPGLLRAIPGLEQIAMDAYPPWPVEATVEPRGE